MWLGGDDFDHAVMDHVMREVKKEYGVDPSGDGRFMTLLKKASEKAKIQLSELLSASIVLEAAVPLSDGGRGDVDVELTRREFEDLPISEEAISFGGVDTVELRRWCEDLKINGTYTDSSVTFGPDTVRNRIRKTLLLTRKAMKESGVTKDQIDHVLLVGGSTTIPLVQRMLEEEFGPEKIMRNIDPMSCVAHGAGIAAERIAGIVCQNVIEKGADGKDRLCLEHNAPDATVCRSPKCGAPLVAQKFCPACNYSNTMDAKRCSSPAGCSYEFRRIDAGNVTAKPVGIYWQGEYEIIIPRGTPYPMFEPVIKPFRTAADSQMAMLIPIYHAEMDEFNPKDPNHWIGAVDINFEGVHLPAGTCLDVSISIDQDGCMDVEAIIQDGSGRRQRVFIDPKLGVNTGQKEGGEGDVEAFETNTRDGERSSGVGESEDVGDWESFLRWSIVWAEIALRKYDWLRSDLGKTQALRERISEARDSLARKDRMMGRRLEKEIVETLRAGSKGV